MVDLVLLREFFQHALAHHIRYRLGAKCPQYADTADVREIDCSGFVRWALARASHGELILPEGSQNQIAWCRAHWESVPYEDAAVVDGKLRIAFISPPRQHNWPRHVWLVLDGRTMESRARAGVSGREWQAYTHRTSGCFEVPG